MTRIGIDTGGTFTDFVIARKGGGGITTWKEPSTPDDPARAILSGLRHAAVTLAGAEVIHGSTVATNALLTGRTARIAFVTNRGFEDLLVRAETQNLSDLAARVRLRRGELARLAGDRAAARIEFDRALEWVERTRASLGAEDYRAAFLEDKDAVFQRSLELALEDGDQETARRHLENFLAFNETHYDAHRSATFDFTWRDGTTYTCAYAKQTPRLNLQKPGLWKIALKLEVA